MKTDHESQQQSGRQMPPIRGMLLGALAGMILSLAGCSKHSQPAFTFMPDMAFSPALKAQEQGAMRYPVKGTIPRGYMPYNYSMSVEDAGRTLKNPLPRSMANLQRGQTMYNTYCLVCHGPNGEGDGTIIPKFPRPPSLQEKKIIDYADGSIFHVITKGQNLMPSYAAQVEENDRWAIIHYIRALQMAKHPSPEDVKAAERIRNQE